MDLSLRRRERGQKNKREKNERILGVAGSSPARFHLNADEGARRSVPLQHV